jgi:ABC-type uncharacterized transport system substrate-binding protein
LKILKAGVERDFEVVAADLANLHVAGLLVSADPFFDSWRQKLVSLAARYAVPAVYVWREFADVGGLISYGPSRTVIWRQAGLYAGKILKGRKAGRFAGAEAQAVRAGGKPQDRQGARPDGPALDPRPRRRADRIASSAGSRETR